MKKYTKKIWIGIVTGVLLIFVITTILHMQGTYSGNEVKDYCLENSKVDASDFRPSGISKLEGYIFWVADSEKEIYKQEIFVFHKELLWGIFDLGRYSLVKQVTGEENQLVSSVRFDVQSQLADRETRVVLFFSSNPKMITYYKIKFQENGVYGEITGSVSQEEPFVVGITEVGNYDYISRVYEGAEFYDENYEILEKEE